MQYVVRLSSLTYDCTQVTPSSALRSMTLWHSCAPSLVTGMCSPSGKVRCTMYLGMWFS
jgi:hypothetical protein